ncbi:MAG: glycosyltransferase [Patescibacteria group bacterium]|jgi:glycosyltransferase involved in cell wall biosynthesis
MKILQVNKFYYPRGGADKYFLWLTGALKKAGHEVAVFSMEHPKNLPTPWSLYFASRISFNEGGVMDKLKAPGRVLYSFSVRKKFSRLIKDFRPDVIHIHNIYHHLSPSILTVAGRNHIPVVMHLHDYKLISPDYNLLNAAAGSKRDARPKKYYQYLFSRDVKDSYAATVLAVVEMYLHHSILNIYRKNVSVFIAPSRFMKDAVVKAGWPEDKISVVYNPYSPDLEAETPTGKNPAVEDYLFYFGRLNSEKGIATLIKAAARISQKVKIAGIGPEESALKKITEELKAQVEFLGFQAAAELRPLITGAKAVIIPSIWPENMPLSLLEAMNLGKIVIAARIGGLPEIIKDGENGLLFNPGDEDDLIRQIKRLDSVDREKLSRAATATASNFSPENNLTEIIHIYKHVIRL